MYVSSGGSKGSAPGENLAKSHVGAPPSPEPRGLVAPPRGNPRSATGRAQVRFAFEFKSVRPNGNSATKQLFGKVSRMAGMVIQWLFCRRIAIRPYRLKLKLKWNLSNESRISPRWRHQLLRWAWKAIIWLFFFSWNLHENKRNWTPGGRPWRPLGSANAEVFWKHLFNDPHQTILSLSSEVWSPRQSFQTLVSMPTACVVHHICSVLHALPRWHSELEWLHADQLFSRVASLKPCVVCCGWWNIWFCRHPFCRRLESKSTLLVGVGCGIGVRQLVAHVTVVDGGFTSSGRDCCGGRRG